MSADRTGPAGEEAKNNRTNGAAAHAPVPPTALERRYRRLLRCYPPSHRADHREEMLGVLLDAARPGQRAPGLTQTVNLVACGLAIRGRRTLAAGPWQDALAVVSLGPVIPASLAACSLAFSPGPRRGLAIAGRRRAFLLLAGLTGVYGYVQIVQLVNPYPSVTSPAFRLLDALAVVVAVALMCVPGTARGRIGALLASGLVLDLAGLPFGNGQTATVAIMLGNVLLALVVWPVAIASWKRRVSRA